MIADGAIIGVINHFLAKSRDTVARRAKDFNEAADTLAVILTKERCYPHPTSNIDFFSLRRMLSPRDRRSFDKSIEEYKKAKKDSAIDYPIITEDYFERASSGIYHDPAPIIEAIDRLLAFTKRK